MGWTSTSDPVSNLLLTFDTKDEAIAFANKQQWKYDLTETEELTDKDGKLSYSYNFLPENIQHRMAEEGTKVSSHFTHPGSGKSHFVKTLKYHGVGVVAQHGGDVSSTTDEESSKSK